MGFFKRRSKRYCPLCDNESRFRRYGVKGRSGAKCSACGSLERHRLVYLYMKNERGLFSNDTRHGKIRLLHVAPEPTLSRIFLQNPDIEYLSSDIDPAKAMVEMNIENIGYPDGSFDVVYCSHVLEHVSDDRKAMRELYRILSSEGWAILQVPLRRDSENTLEDPEINTPKLRKKYYGQKDHLRYYGFRDFKNELENAGFTVEVVNYFQNLDPSVVDRCSLLEEDLIFLCKKQN